MIETNVIKEFKKALKAFVKEIQKKKKIPTMMLFGMI